MSKYCVYKITTPKDKVYVGMTSNFQKRINQHKSTKHTYLRKAIDDHGFDNLSKQKVSTFDNEKKAKEIESKLIQRHQQLGKSLNGTNNGVATSHKIALEIDKDLKADVKVKCAREGLTITEVVTKLLEDWTND